MVERKLFTSLIFGVELPRLPGRPAAAMDGWPGNQTEAISLAKAVFTGWSFVSRLGTIDVASYSNYAVLAQRLASNIVIQEQRQTPNLYCNHVTEG